RRPAPPTGPRRRGRPAHAPRAAPPALRRPAPMRNSPRPPPPSPPEAGTGLHPRTGGSDSQDLVAGRTISATSCGGKHGRRLAVREQRIWRISQKHATVRPVWSRNDYRTDTFDAERLLRPPSEERARPHFPSRPPVSG